MTLHRDRLQRFVERALVAAVVMCATHAALGQDVSRL